MAATSFGAIHQDAGQHRVWWHRSRRAVYFIVNGELGRLHASCHLEMDLRADETSVFPRGLIPVDLPNGDVLEVGIDGMDELLVRYACEQAK